jgi:hypothetical protein
VNREQLTEVNLRTGDVQIAGTGLTFPYFVAFFPPTGELVYCTGPKGLTAVHPTTGAQRLLATAEELGLPVDLRHLRLCPDVDPARDRMFFHSHETGRTVVALSGLCRSN